VERVPAGEARAVHLHAAAFPGAGQPAATQKRMRTTRAQQRRNAIQQALSFTGSQIAREYVLKPQQPPKGK
jgi:uncharacterized protein (DUF849 family)